MEILSIFLTWHIFLPEFDAKSLDFVSFLLSACVFVLDLASDMPLLPRPRMRALIAPAKRFPLSSTRLRQRYKHFAGLSPSKVGYHDA